jgi:hypothetical protein
MGEIGWVKLKRSMRDHPLWAEKPFSRAQAWIDLVLRANFTDTKIPSPGRSGVVVLGHGELIGSLRGFQASWGWSLNKVLRFLRYLKAEKMIATVNESTFTRIKLLNWKRHQHEETNPKTDVGGGASVYGACIPGDRQTEAPAEAAFQQGKRRRTEAPAEAPTEAPSDAPTEPILRREEVQQPQEDKKVLSVDSTSTVAPTTEGTPDGDDSGSVVVVGEDQTGEAFEGKTGDVEALLSKPSPRIGTALLEEIGVGKRISHSLAASHPIRRIYDVVELARNQSNPGGYARSALDQGWVVGEANGEGLKKLISDLEREAADRASSSLWKTFLPKRDPANERRPGESDEDYLRRGMAAKKAKMGGGRA